MKSKSRIGFVLLFGLTAYLVWAQGNAEMGPGMAPEQAAGLAADHQGEAIPSVTSETTSTTQTVATNSVKFGEQYGPVNNETLWSIARKLVKNTNYSIHQGVNAIKTKNPQAFHHEQLKNGVLLNLPTEQEMTQ